MVVAVPVSGGGLLWAFAGFAGLGAVWFVVALVYAVISIPDNYPTNEPATPISVAVATTTKPPAAACYPFADCTTTSSGTVVR